MKRMMIVGACLLVLVLISSPLVIGGQMPMGGQMDPKAMPRMLALRGDLLKAMGEVMLKHAKAMEGGQ